MARGIWSGTISFGFLNIPVSLKSAKEEERISFKMLDKRDHAPIGYKRFNKSTGREIDNKNIVKAYEVNKNQYVEISDEDLVQANPVATQTIDIEDFVNVKDIDFLMFEKPYYMIPGKNGEKGYLLLQKVLTDTKKAAIAKFVMHDRQHLVAIMAQGDYLILETLRFAHEVREVDEAEYLKDVDFKKVKISAREMKAAKALVDEMTTKWAPEKYKDTYQDELLKYIHRKLKSGNVEAAPEVAHESAEEASNVLDMMELLEKSLKHGGHRKHPAGRPTLAKHHRA